MARYIETRIGRAPEQTDSVARLGKKDFPWTSETVTVPIERMNHGSLMIVGWATHTHPVFEEIFRGLPYDQQEKVREQVRREAGKISSDGNARNIGVLSANGKTDVHVLPVGHPNDPKRLMAYYTRGTWMGNPAVFLFAGTNLKESDRIQRTLARIGYKNNKRIKNGNHGVRR
jgi:hypothetical protein